MATITRFAIFSGLLLLRHNAFQLYRSQLPSGSSPFRRFTLFVARYRPLPCGRGCPQPDRSACFRPPHASARLNPCSQEVIRCSRIGACRLATCPPRPPLHLWPVPSLFGTIRHRETRPARRFPLHWIRVCLVSRLPRAAPRVSGRYQIQTPVVAVTKCEYQDSNL